jgi:hypothetical protein
MNILFSSVFGPYGVDDAYGRKENLMELFHNQVTREQGLFSLRFHHESFGLHFLAENVRAPATVLDFPSEERFVREIRKGYDIVGISFITPNAAKARRMAELVRLHAPQSKIVLGGHGTMIPGIEDLVEHDHICRGEGVKWFRRLLGEDPDRPFRHPAMLSSFSNHILGVPFKTSAAVLIPGVGCPNACRFCSTSHFFDKTYTPYFDTGKELFDLCESIENAIGSHEFFIMDENFLKRPERARELLRLMEERGKFWRFAIFSSAETVAQMGVEFLARLGIYMIWIGVESKQEIYEKNKGIDLQAMIRSLRDHGIMVLASGILFLEQHDEKTIWDDIRFVAGMEPDLVQFMQLGPMPQTKLFLDYKRKGILRTDVPYEEWHGQGRIWFEHPHFSPEESEKVLRAAFRYDFDTNGSSLLRMCDTTVRGYRTLSGSKDPYLARRGAMMKKAVGMYTPVLPVLKRYAQNDRVRSLTDDVIAKFREAMGAPTLTQRIVSVVARAAASREAARVAAGANVYQPKTRETRYRRSVRDLVAGALQGRRLSNLLNLDILWGPGPVRVKLGGTLDKVNAGMLAKKIRAFLKGENREVFVDLDRVQAIEGRALSRFLKGVRHDRGRVKVVCKDGAEAVRAVIAGLPEKFAGFFAEGRSQPV